MKKDLKRRFMIPVFMVATFGLFILCFTSYYQAKKLLSNYIEKRTEDKVEKLVTSIDNKLEKWISTVEFFSQYDSVKNFKHGEFFSIIKENKEYTDNFQSVIISNLNGDYVSHRWGKGNIKDRKYFVEVLKGKTVISDPIISKSTGEACIVIASPIKQGEKIKGVISVNISLSRLTDLINLEKIGKEGYAFMLDSTGQLMAYPNKKLILKNNMITEENKGLSNICNNMVSGIAGVGEYIYKGENKIIAYRPIKKAPWSVGMTANYKEIAKDIEALRNFMFSTGFLIITSILGALYLLIKSVTTPIEEIKESIKIATEGDLSVQCHVNREDELGDLAKSLNTLINENKRLLDEAIEYDKLKVEFFSNISHELKTPLNLIFSTVQMLNLYFEKINETTGNKIYEESVRSISGNELGDIGKDESRISLDVTKIESYVDIIEQNTYRLIRLVDNLIDVTRIDSGSMEIELNNNNIVEIVEDITLVAAKYMDKIDRNIIFDTNKEDIITAVDQDKIERIVLNLISNAIKSTEKGDTIKVEVLNKLDKVEIVVKDTGKGIAKEKQELIFERFRQADELYIRNHEGSGIGLSIVRSLIEMHGGEIKLNSNLGEGTEVIVTLPIKILEGNIREQRIFKESKEIKVRIEFSDIYN